MPSILVVDTHRPTRELLADHLRQQGYRVVEVEEPAEAADRFAFEKPDAVVIAVDLPKVKGAHPGALIRGSEAGQKIPIVAVDKAHLGKAKGVVSILDVRPDAYFGDATKLAEVAARLGQLVAAAAARKAPAGSASVLSRREAFKGDLKSLELPGQYLDVLRHRRDGVLLITRGDLARRIYFLGGAPVNYDSTSRQDSLGRYLVADGAATEAQYEAHLGKLRDGLSPAAALVAVGALRPGEELVQRLRDYARARIAEAVGMRDGSYRFHPGDEFRSDLPALEIPALAPILEGARRGWPVRVFATALAPHRAEYPFRTPAFARDLPQLGLATGDLKLALRITGRGSLADLLQQGELKEIVSLVWFLHRVGSIEFSAIPAASVDAGLAGAEHTPGPVASRLARAVPRLRKKPLPAEIEKSLHDDAVAILTASYFRVLGLDIAADGEAVERAYHLTATHYHPETYGEYDTAGIEDLLASVQDRIAAAYRVLSVEEKRKAYLAYLLGQKEVPRSERLNVDAEIEIKRGEAALRDNLFSEAIAAFERAIALNPREPEYYSYLAWATFKGLPASREERARAALKLCKKALQLHPDLERPQVIWALVEDEAGEPAEARRMLLRLLQQNPGCELAKKALHALDRRRGYGEASPRSRPE